MKILVLDTSSKYLSLAVAEDNRLLSKMHRHLDRKHSTRLVSFIDELLKKAKLPLEKIDGFCVGKGPGSFTGLRIGITTIKGLAFVMQKPVVAVPSLDILAQNVNRIKTGGKQDSALQVCPIIDAKQSKVYACLYQIARGKIVRKSAYLLLSLEELLKRLQGKIIFLGDAVSLYHQRIRRSKKIKPVFAAAKFWYPQAAQVIPLALQRFRSGQIEDVATLRPLYLYPQECQIKRRTNRVGER